MTEQRDDLEKRIENTRRLLDRARANLSEMRRLRESMERSYPDYYRNAEYWTVKDQLKSSRVRLIDKERQVSFLEKQLAAFEAELKELKS